jgi:hypothetical protein
LSNCELKTTGRRLRVTTNRKARDPRYQKHRIQIPDNCAKTALGGVRTQAVLLLAREMEGP